MNKIVTIHSFRRGVGKSTLTANLAALLALQGHRVAVVDTDFQASSTQSSFKLSNNDSNPTFNDYLWGKCELLATVQDVTPILGAETTGKLFVIPASTQVVDVMQMLRTPLNLERYTGGLEELGKELKLAYLLVDTRAGLDQDTLASIAISNHLVLVFHPDQQDFQATAVTVDVARRLQVPAIHLVLNDAAETLNVEEMSQQLEQTYHCGESTVLTHNEELMVLGQNLFVLSFPDHPLTAQLKLLAERL
jgi:MinD-like ATPase involved in chromosome partitioning or flagellar assembly